MTTKKCISLVCIVATLFCITSCDLFESLLTGADPANSNDFSENIEGWLIEGDANKTNPEYSDTSGLENSGYIFAKDNTTGGVWYFVAPEKYHGSKIKFFNGYIQFYLIQESAMANQFFQKDIIIDGGAEGSMVYYFKSYPELTWTHYKIQLNDNEAWYNAGETLATNDEIGAVLGNVEGIRIRGEYESGPDTGGLDDFSFTKR